MEKSRQTEQPILSSDVLKSIKNCLSDGRFLTSDYQLTDSFFGFVDKIYEMFLADGEIISSKNIAKVLPYLLERTPQELLNPDSDVHLILSNDNKLFIKNIEVLKTADKRRRWYYVEVEHQNKVGKTVYWHIRDDEIVSDKKEELIGGTDSIEMMSFLSLLHILKQSDYTNFEKLTREDSTSAKLYESLKNKFPFLNSQEAFEKWKSQKFDVRLDFDKQREGAVDLFINDLKERVPKRNEGDHKPFLLIGNDFSLRLTMFSLLVDQNTTKTLEEMYKNDLEEFRKTFKKGPYTGKNDLKNSLEKYFLLTLLNKDYGRAKNNQKKSEKDNEIISVYENLFTEDNYKKLGYDRLLFGVRKLINQLTTNNQEVIRSILGEPVDYWDPKLFKQNMSSILSDEPAYIKTIFKQLVEFDQPILSIPYLNGKITPSIIKKIIKAGLVDPKIVGFLGKVGLNVGPNEKDTAKLRGAQIMPITVARIENGIQKIVDGVRSFYKFKEGDAHFISELISFVPFITTPAVTIQTNKDVTNNKGEREFGDRCVFESELGYIMDDEELKNVTFILSYFISDISGGSKEDTINKAMTASEGALGVGMSTFFSLLQLVRYREEEHNKKLQNLGLLVFSFLKLFNSSGDELLQLIDKIKKNRLFRTIFQRISH